MASQHGHHVTPKKTLYKVFGALVALTVLTALTAEFVELGALNVPLAIAIAGSKALLVATFFMALKYDNRVNTLVFMLGIVFVGVFLIFTLFDTIFRGDLGNVGTETISETERLESAMRERESSRQSEGTTPETVPGGEADESGTGSEADESGTGSTPDEVEAADPDTTAADTSSG